MTDFDYDVVVIGSGFGGYEVQEAGGEIQAHI
jgi:pyruvate/2-oxoglutarate dehydrogenase complex dihydrolipoamide dehydrogenase (E3) component